MTVVRFFTGKTDIPAQEYVENSKSTGKQSNSQLIIFLNGKLNANCLCHLTCRFSSPFWQICCIFGVWQQCCRVLGELYSRICDSRMQVYTYPPLRSTKHVSLAGRGDICCSCLYSPCLTVITALSEVWMAIEGGCSGLLFRRLECKVYLI